MNIFSKKQKSLIYIFIISSLISFLLCFFLPAKGRISFYLKAFFFEIPNTGYYNYKIINDKFIATNDEHFVYINNINGFIKNVNIKFTKILDKDVSLKLFVNDIDLGKTLLVYEEKANLENEYNVQIYRNIKNVMVVIGDKKADSFYLDSITCNNDIFYFTGVNVQNCLTQLKYMNFWIRFLIVFIFLFFVFSHFFFNINSLYEWLYKNRYLIGLCIILFTILFELNNSSIDLWRFLNTDNSQNSSDIILGKPRLIRSDEWSTYTPMLLSQSPDYEWFSSSLRGGNTDVFMTYGQPVKNVASVFRPFLLGFLFLGSAKGLSFFWIVRLVLLFLISFEFLMLISNKNKIVSLTGTFLITFAPAVQWWWTPSGLAEMIIYCELLILLLNNYITQKKFIKRFLIIFFTMVFTGSYMFVLYPAWQVPMAYIFAIIVLWILVENYKDYKFNKKDILPISISIILFVIALLYIYGKSKETIDLINNTVYPGARFETGGDKLTEYSIGYNSFAHIFRYWGNIFLPLFENNLKTNPCNFAVFFDLFPIGLIVSFIVLFKDKVKDKLLIMLLFLYVFFTVWCAVGFPKFLSQITMMKVSPAYRTIVILSFLNVLMFIRSISLLKYRMNRVDSFVISFITTILIVVSNILIYEYYFDAFKIIVVSILSFVLFYLILRNKINKLFMFLIILTMILSGLLVNPIQKGINVVNNLELSKIIKKIDTHEKGLWIVEHFYYYAMNFPIMQGIRTLNSTNTYPNIDVFKLLDNDGKYNYVYNRYAHVFINLVHENDMLDKFVLLGLDCFKINMTVDDILKLNIKYIFTIKNLDEFNNDKINFEKLYYCKTKNFDIYIYKVNNIHKDKTNI